ncbi:MAG TPA: zinc ribbon domain-containing protein [Steroidobacteraceae bacterium]|nr:zinc ribbon domain-containing protein [Steroidobacteraceae bacterium]
MPLYEYECRACGHHHEAMQKMNAAPLRKCPACGKSRLARVLSAPVFRLKGGGWYETDFKSDKESRRNLHGEEKADKAESPSETPAAKADTAAAPATDTAKGDATVPPKTTPKDATAAPAAPAGGTAKPARKRARRR